MGVAQWDKDQWHQAITLVRQWNDQCTQTVKEIVAENHPETTEAQITLVASGFMSPRNTNASDEDHIAWLAIQAATLLVEQAQKALPCVP